MSDSWKQPRRWCIGLILAQLFHLNNRALSSNLLHDFDVSPWSPPVRAEWEAIGSDLISYLIESGRLVRVSADVLFSSEAYSKLVEWTTRTLDNGGEVTVALLRDQFATSRKYALAFLEHLDERKITRRVGDVRLSIDRRYSSIG